AGALAPAAATVAAALPTAPARAVTATAFVRVNQIGYSATSQAKRAYLMASGVETGATFDVRNSSNTTVFSGPIGTNLGSWSTAYPDVYALHFKAMTPPHT